MSVGLTCKSVWSWLFLRLTLTSKKFISSLDHSAVNLIVGWKAISVSVTFFQESSSSSQIKNIPSIYLHHMCGCSLMPSRILSSRSAINSIAYGEANLVPITVKFFHRTESCCSVTQFLQALLKFQFSFFLRSLI